MSSIIKTGVAGWTGQACPAMLLDLLEPSDSPCPASEDEAEQGVILADSAAIEPPAPEEVAARIIAEAEARAVGIIAEAEGRSAAITELARAEGYACGLDKGQAEWRERLDALEARALEMEEERIAFLEAAEPELAALAIEVARKVLKQELEQRPEAVLTVVRACMHRLKDREARIRVNPKDLESVRGARESFLGIADGVSDLEIVSDRRVQPGGCIVETPSGNVDARIETQLSHIAEVIHNGLEDERDA